jgi:hypothetical protein
MITVKRALPLAILTLTMGLLAVADGAWAAVAPVKQIEVSHFGWEVNQTTKGNICTVASGNACQPGKPSSEPGGFEYPEAIAGAAPPSNDVFVTDQGNHRVQELEADGKFVLMFGRKVNKKGGDLCTAAEAAECQAGEEGSAPGQFTSVLQSIAVDSASSDVYVAEHAPGGGERVQVLTPTGQFMLEIGRKVNKKGGNLCTAAEVASCTAPEPGLSPEPGAFHYSEGLKNMLAVGGLEDLLYVGDEHRVQEFDAKTGSTNGQYVREIPLASISAVAGALVTRIAVSATGRVYLVYNSEPELVREFDSTGNETASFQMGSFVVAIAVNSAGRLAVSEFANAKTRGTLYEDVELKPGVHALHVSTRFVSHDADNLAFNSKDEMFAAFGGGSLLDPVGHEVISWEPVPVAEPIVKKPECVPGPEHETDVTLDCTLQGEVNPWGVAETEVWFRWGRTEAFGMETPKQPVITGSTLVGVSAQISEVLPGENLYDELVGEDHNVKAPEEPLTSPTVEKLTTPTVPPRIVGKPIAAFQTPTSSVFFGQVNPENTLTSYEFQYAPEKDCDKGKLAEGKSLAEACTGMLQTSESQSSQYGQVGAALEGTGLQPATAYRYRLYAVNAKGQGALGETGGAQLPEGTFETAPAPVVTALTGEAGMITMSSAVISGSVNSDGQPSVYTFELGVYNGASTHYGTVLSAPAVASTTPVQEALALTGLQPGVTYAYRITIHFGDGAMPGSSAIGEARLFTTLGLPAVLVSPAALPMLGVLPISFPVEPKVSKTKKTKTKKTGKRHKKGKKSNRRAAKKSIARKHKHETHKGRK